MMLVGLLSLLLNSAQAGSGPWVVSQGDLSFYGGTEFQRFTQLALSSASAADDLDVDDGVETFGAKAIVTYGLRSRFEVEAQVPWYRVDANTQGPVCEQLGLGACETTQGVGAISVRAKALAIDELVGAPVSVAVGAELRFGQFTNDERQRITNMGEGTNDIGGFVSVGRSGGLADGFWSAWAEGGGRYRSPNTEFGVGPVPGAEFSGVVEALAGAQRWWSLGPSANFLWRPQGYDVETVLGRPALATNIDRWGSLSILTVRVGGKLVIRSSDRIDLVAGVLTTAHASNNPSDVTTVSLGLSVHPGPQED